MSTLTDEELKAQVHRVLLGEGLDVTKPAAATRGGAAPRRTTASRSGGARPKGRVRAAANPWVATLHAFVADQAAATEKLSMRARAVWHYLHARADGRDRMRVRQGVEQAASELGISRRLVQLAVGELISSGYLRRVSRGQRQRGVTVFEVRGRAAGD